MVTVRNDGVVSRAADADAAQPQISAESMVVEMAFPDALAYGMPKGILACRGMVF